MLYILEYRRNGVEGDFEFAGLITIQEGKVVHKYKELYRQVAEEELKKLPPDLAVITRSGDDITVSRKSVIYSEDDLETLFQDYLDAERTLVERKKRKG